MNVFFFSEILLSVLIRFRVKTFCVFKKIIQVLSMNEDIIFILSKYHNEYHLKY